MITEEQIQIIEDKIANLPTEFDLEEEYIICLNPKLFELLYTTLVNNPSLCTEEIADYIGNVVFDKLYSEYEVELYPLILENSLKIMVPSNKELDEVLTQLNISESTIANMKKQVKEVFMNPSSTIDNFYISENSILELSDYGRYDIISQIGHVTISNQSIQKIWEKYPFDKYTFPPLFTKNNYIVEKYISKFPLNFAVIAYMENLKHLNYAYETDEDDIQNKRILSVIIKSLKKQLNEVNELDIDLIEKNVITIPYLSYNLEQKLDKDIFDEVKDLTLRLFELGFIQLGNTLLEYKIIDRQVIRNLIIEYLKTNNTEALEKLYDTGVFNKFYEDRELGKFLLENGYINFARNISFLFVHENQEYIIEQYRQKNEKFKNNAKIVEYTGTEDYELNKAMLESGFVEKLIIKHTMQKYSEVEISQIKYLLNTFPQIEVSTKKNYKDEDVKIIEILEECHRYETIINYIKEEYSINIKTLLTANKNKLLNKVIRNNFKDGIELFDNHADLILQIPELLDEYFKKDTYTYFILNRVHHDETLMDFYTAENYEKTKYYLSRKYKLSIEFLDKIAHIFGPLIIRYIENENIRQLSLLSEEELEKILELFSTEEYTMADLEGIYDSLKQYEFGKKYPKEVQIFPTLLHAIEDKDDEQIETLINKISLELDNTFLKRFSQKYDLPQQYIFENNTSLIRLVIEKIKKYSGDKQEKYKVILHEMTDYYISKKREQYRETYNLEEELDLPYELDQKSVDNILVKYIIKDAYQYNTMIDKESEDKPVNVENNFFGDWVWPQYSPKYRLDQYFVNCLKVQGISQQIAEETLEYYINKDKTQCSDFKKVQETIPLLIKIAKEVLNEIKKDDYFNTYGIRKNDIENYIDIADENDEVKRLYKIVLKNSSLEILTQLNIEAIRKGVLSNPEIYKSLLNTMRKRKLHLLPENISNILGSEYINISPELTNVAGFISYYAPIYDTAKKSLESLGKQSDNILLNFSNILIYSEVYSGVSNVYSQILGSKDAKLIKANPTPNAADRKLSNNQRLKEAVELTIGLFKRQEITIPTFDEVVPLEDGKEMQIIVGNFTHPSNLTHGERTGACMRIGGVGESLFQFALENPNGFHIRFEDPKTHEYISRVTGFRNGNTVFLNELRDSCNKKKYNNDDVISACTKAAQLLIELSKDSSCPIENVVVHKAYATEKMSKPMQYLGVDNIKSGLPKFYSDVGSSAIILATTAQESKFVPIDFNKNNIPIYHPVRSKPEICTTVTEASGKINRVNAVKKMLEGENYEYIEPYEFPNDLIYAIVNDDWYVYVNENGQIFTDYIAIDSRAKIELTQALTEINNKIDQILKEHQEVKYGL